MKPLRRYLKNKKLIINITTPQKDSYEKNLAIYYSLFFSYAILSIG
jgi:hypothetical protein